MAKNELGGESAAGQDNSARNAELVEGRRWPITNKWNGTLAIPLSLAEVCLLKDVIAQSLHARSEFSRKQSQRWYHESDTDLFTLFQRFARYTEPEGDNARQWHLTLAEPLADIHAALSSVARKVGGTSRVEVERAMDTLVLLMRTMTLTEMEDGLTRSLIKDSKCLWKALDPIIRAHKAMKLAQKRPKPKAKKKRVKKNDKPGVF